MLSVSFEVPFKGHLKHIPPQCHNTKDTVINYQEININNRERERKVKTEEKKGGGGGGTETKTSRKTKSIPISNSTCINSQLVKMKFLQQV